MVENMMEQREETMVSLSGSDPFTRTAHFIRPICKNSLPVSPFRKNQNFDVKKAPLMVKFRGTSYPQDRWKEWVFKLLPIYHNVWKKAGIYDSILNSTYKIVRDNDLILALSERWCVETNTFVFPWGESSITLEDMIVLGGYSVLGDYVSDKLSTNEMLKLEEKLVKVKKKLELGAGKFTTHLAWMEEFVDSDDELTHVAFLSLWLSRYVFGTGFGGVGIKVFPIAVHLSLGTRLAIAPAVLAVLYRDLSLVKNSLVSSSKGSDLNKKGVSLKTNIWAPFQLVMIWAWERFPTLRPRPNPIQVGEPRLARWHDLTQLKVDNLGKALDSAGEVFQWRPYCMVVNNWKYNGFYRLNGELITVESGMDEEIESFAICIRPSELVGLGGFVEQYLPHRVAMQFGYDQDIPGFVPRFNESPKSAWEYFKRPMTDKMLYIPPRLFESDVTLQYFSWWGATMTTKEAMIESNVEKTQSKSNNKASKKRKENKEDCDPLDGLSIGELLRLATNTKVVEKGVIRVDECLKGNGSGNFSPLVLENGAREDKEMVPDPMDSSVTNHEKEFPSWYKPCGPSLELEDRISRLEKLVSKLKAENLVAKV